jgi:aryl sulfotransferase
VARHPLDAAVSMYHHRDNIDRVRMRELTGAPAPAEPAEPSARPTLHEWLVGYVDWDPEPREWLDSLPGTMLHLADAWARRADPKVVLVHYDDLIGDLAGEMRRLSSLLGIPVHEARWSGLVRAARFDAMRRQAATMSPDTKGVLKDRAAFFRHGVSGEGRAMLSGEEMARYRARVAALAPPDLLAWLHRDGEA